MKSITLSKTDIERFWSKVEKSNINECWTWQAHRNNNGYGIFSIKAILLLAHRTSWVIHFGEIPNGLQVCHKCDNPPCVNPNHLFLGTMRINMDDKMAKGRYKKGLVYRGEDHKLAKLKDSDIPTIRSLYDNGFSTHIIGEIFNVDSKTIWNVGKRISWSHVR